MLEGDGIKRQSSSGLSAPYESQRSDISPSLKFKMKRYEEIKYFLPILQTI